MQIGEVIRKYRKIKNLTQEEMANRLGVTAPAVNKWENGNSLPDIMLLAPIARLLDITLDTLLSFREELTAEEIWNIIREVEGMLKREEYETVFQWAKQKMEEYPNCEQLLLNLAAVLDGQRMMKAVPESERYDGYLLDCYKRVLDSRDEGIRTQAADLLFSFYMRKEQYGRAEEYLQYFSAQNPARKRKQALVCARTGRIREAYKAYEEILYADYIILSEVFQGMYDLAMRENNREKAHMLAEKQQELARLLEMGRYQEFFCGLDLAAAEKDTAAALKIMEELLSGVDQMGSARQSPLYEHMTFKELNGEFLEELKETLKKGFRENEGLAFLKEEPEFLRMIV